MESKKTFKPLPTRHLTDDDVVQFESKSHGAAPFRVRIWRCAADVGDGQGLRSFAPIVLVGHVSDPDCMWPAPSLLTAKVANYINASVLRYPVAGLFYFEDEVIPVLHRDKETNIVSISHEARKLSQVRFEYFGCAARLKFFKPERFDREWSDLEQMVGSETIER